MFRIHKYDRNYDRNEDFTRKLQFVITKVLQEITICNYENTTHM